MDSRLLQLADSAFPTGSFAHSAGFEALAQLGRLRGEAALAARLRELAWRAGYGALPFLADAHAGDAARADRAADAFLVDRVANRASRAQGRALLLAAAAAFGDGPVKALGAELPRGHAAPATGAAFGRGGVSLDDARQLFLFGAVRAALSAAVRLGAVGPLRAQALLFGLHPHLDEVLRATRGLGAADACNVAPLVETAQAAHDRLYSRLFQSLPRKAHAMSSHDHDGLGPHDHGPHDFGAPGPHDDRPRERAHGAHGHAHDPGRGHAHGHDAHGQAHGAHGAHEGGHGGHGHRHDRLPHAGRFDERDGPLGRDYAERAFTVGVGGPVGSGKTALLLALCRRLRDELSLGVVTNDIFTREDAEFLVRHRALPPERIRAVETGGCPHAAIREDITPNLLALGELMAEVAPELLLVESGGDNLAAQYSRELVDYTIYVIDVAGGDKVPRKGGPGITQSDLLLINKTDLAPLVGASLDVMARDARAMRGDGPTVFAQAAHGVGLEEVVRHVLDARRAALGDRAGGPPGPARP